MDLAQVIHADYNPDAPPRLSVPDLEQIRTSLAANGLRLREDEAADQKLAKLRSLYEPYAYANAARLLISLPPWIRRETRKDNWQSGPWDKMIQKKEPALGSLVLDDHF